MSRRQKPHWPAPIPIAERKRSGRPVTPLIPVEEAGLGPAMLALNAAMRGFVIAKITYGCSNAEAARLAGYSVRSPHAADVHGSRLAHDERIQSAILEEGQKLMRTEGPKSIHTLVEIRDDKTADKKDRMKAAVELLNRSGFNAVTQHNISVEHSLSDTEKDRRILELARELGLPQIEAQKLLIAPDKAIDADFVEVKSEEPLTEEDARRVAKQERDNELRRQRRDMSPQDLAEHKKRVKAEQTAKKKVKRAEAEAERATRRAAEQTELEEWLSQDVPQTERIKEEWEIDLPQGDLA